MTKGTKGMNSHKIHDTNPQNPQVGPGAGKPGPFRHQLQMRTAVTSEPIWWAAVLATSPASFLARSLR